MYLSVGVLSFARGGRYSDMVERYIGGYEGALLHGDSANFVVVIALMRDSSEVSLLAQSASTTSCTRAGCSTPKMWDPHPKSVFGGLVVWAQFRLGLRKLLNLLLRTDWSWAQRHYSSVGGFCPCRASSIFPHILR